MLESYVRAALLTDSSPHPVWPNARGGLGESGPPSTTYGLQAALPTTAAAKVRAAVLGMPCQGLEKLAPSTDHRKTRDGSLLASEGLSSLLDLDLQEEWRPPKSQLRDPSIDQEDSDSQPALGCPRIHGELLKLGISISERTVSRLLHRRHKPPSQPWRTFLDNHVNELVSVDFFTVPTAPSGSFSFWWCWLTVGGAWFISTSPSIRPPLGLFSKFGRFPEDHARRHLVRDRDSVYGDRFRDCMREMGISEVLTAPQSPWQNAFAERLIGLHSAGMPGSPDRLGKEAPAKDSAQLL
jgi:hypothetical protein